MEWWKSYYTILSEKANSDFLMLHQYFNQKCRAPIWSEPWFHHLKLNCSYDITLMEHFHCWIYYLCLLPRQNDFFFDKTILYMTKIICPRQYICSWLKRFFSADLFWIKMDFLTKNGNFQGLISSRNEFFSHGQNDLSYTKCFCHGQYFFAWGKIHFV